jgi:LSD1 subclass zinc finger protein
MSISASCHGCRTAYQLPATFAGKKVRCKKCQQTFLVDAIPGTREEAARKPAEEDKPKQTVATAPESRSGSQERLSSPEEKAAWNKVRRGIHLVMVGLWIWLDGAVAVWALFVLGGLLALSGTEIKAMGVLALLACGLAGLGYIADWLLCLIGYGLCIRPPRSSGLRPLGLATFALFAAATFLALILLVVFFASVSLRSGRAITHPSNSVQLLFAAVSLCVSISFITFVFFLRKLCHILGTGELTRSLIAILASFLSFSVAVFLLLGFLQRMSSVTRIENTNLINVLYCLMGLIYLVLNVWYAFILKKIRAAVAKYRREL